MPSLTTPYKLWPSEAEEEVVETQRKTQSLFKKEPPSGIEMYIAPPYWLLVVQLMKDDSSARMFLSPAVMLLKHIAPPFSLLVTSRNIQLRMYALRDDIVKPFIPIVISSYLSKYKSVPKMLS